jgi:glutamyl-tRNA reductase
MPGAPRPLSPRAASTAAGLAAAPLAALRARTVCHRTVGLDVLPRHALDAAGARALREHLDAAGLASFVLATCNRTEVYWRAAGPDDDAAIARAIDSATAAPGEAGRLLTGRAAAEHLFRVCAGLESLVLGEAEILGQVRTAVEASPGAGPFLQGVARAALRAGRMVRAETAIAAGAQSVASAAVQQLAALLPLAQSRVLVVGAGATGAKVARHLRRRGVGALAVANRSEARAAAVASEVGAQALALADAALALHDADALVCAIDAGGAAITRADLQQAMARRPHRPLVVVDLSMPPAVEPGEVAGVRRVDLAALDATVAAHAAQRAAEVPKANAIVRRELRHLDAWARRQALHPVVSQLRQRAEAIRQAELARAAAELSPADLAAVDRLTRRLLAQVLAIGVDAVGGDAEPAPAAVVEIDL